MLALAAELTRFHGKACNFGESSRVLSPLQRDLASLKLDSNSFAHAWLGALLLWDRADWRDVPTSEPSQLRLIAFARSIGVALANAISLACHNSSDADAARAGELALANVESACRTLSELSTVNVTHPLHAAIICASVGLLVGCTSSFTACSSSQCAVCAKTANLLKSLCAMCCRLLDENAMFFRKRLLQKEGTITGCMDAVCAGVAYSVLRTSNLLPGTSIEPHALYASVVLAAFLYHAIPRPPSHATVIPSTVDQASAARSPTPPLQPYFTAVQSCLSACLLRMDKLSELLLHIALLSNACAHCPRLAPQQPDPPSSASAPCPASTTTAAPSASSSAQRLQATLVPLLWQFLQCAVRCKDACLPIPDSPEPLAYAVRTTALNQTLSERPPSLLEGAALELVYALSLVYHAGSSHELPQLSVLLAALLKTLQSLPFASLLLLDLLCAPQGAPDTGPPPQTPFRPAVTPAQASFVLTLAASCMTQIVMFEKRRQRTVLAQLVAGRALPVMTWLLTQPDRDDRDVAHLLLQALLPQLRTKDAVAGVCLPAFDTVVGTFPLVTTGIELEQSMHVLCTDAAAHPAVVLCCCDAMHVRARQLLRSSEVESALSHAATEGGGERQREFAVVDDSMVAPWNAVSAGRLHAGKQGDVVPLRPSSKLAQQIELPLVDESCVAAALDIVKALMVVVVRGDVRILDAVLRIVSDVWRWFPPPSMCAVADVVFRRLVGCHDHRRKRTCVAWYHRQVHKHKLTAA